MNKTQLIKLLSYQDCSLTQEIISNSIDVILEEIVKGIATGKQAEIRGFGTFVKRSKRQRVIIHPVTKKRIVTKPYNLLHYTYSQKAIDQI